MCDCGEPPVKRARYNLRSYLTKLLDLNDYCLDEIFVHLNVVELCSVTRVCKRFRQLAEWHFKRKFSEFDFSDRLLSSQEARDALRNFGHLMKSVTISTKLFHSHDTIGRVEEGLLKDIVECCGKNIYTLTLKNFNFTSHAVETLNMLAESLQSLCLIECSVTGDCIFHLSKFSLLTRLEIIGPSHYYAFGDVFPALEILRLDHVSIPNNRTLQKFIVAHKQTNKTLVIRRCKGISSQVVKSIGKHLVNLEELYFVRNLMERSELIEQIQKNVQYLSELKNLQRFTWHCSLLSIGNVLANMMSNKIAMKVLCFADARVDAVTIKAIKEMKNLERLCFHQSNGLKNEHLIESVKGMTQLKELFFAWQQTITFDVLKKILRHTKQLMVLGIRLEKFRFDPSMYNDILNIVKERGNGIKLTIKIYSDNIDVVETSSQQTIHMNKNLLMIEYRPL